MLIFKKFINKMHLIVNYWLFLVTIKKNCNISLYKVIKKVLQFLIYCVDIYCYKCIQSSCIAKED